MKSLYNSKEEIDAGTINLYYEHTCDCGSKFLLAIKNDKAYELEVEYLSLRFFDHGIGLLTIQLLNKKYPNLIVDNAQAFYMPHLGLASFYSPRKFFGVADGGYLFCGKKLDEEFSKNTFMIMS